jgi:DNA ligase-1
MGEIRQGALEGLVLEAVALASSLSADRLQRSFMFSGNIGDDIGGQIWIKLRKRIFRK